MRPVPLSTEVYAKIWSLHQPGEDSEDAILRRVLGVNPAAAQSAPAAPAKIGFSDPRFKIELPEGFVISRIYKGVEYRAVARDGKWHLESTGASYSTLNQLSQAVSGNVENAWRNWYFTGQDGKRYLMLTLRNPNVRVI
jgi:hypothetical protein